jgi:sulfur carrier protein ThiS
VGGGSVEYNVKRERQPLRFTHQSAGSLMQLHLGGHLGWYDSQKRSWLEIDLPETTTLSDIVQRLGVPLDEIAIATVNGQVVSLKEAHVSDDDRVELYPPVGGGSCLAGARFAGQQAGTGEQAGG